MTDFESFVLILSRNTFPYNHGPIDWYSFHEKLPKGMEAVKDIKSYYSLLEEAPINYRGNFKDNPDSGISGYTPNSGIKIYDDYYYNEVLHELCHWLLATDHQRKHYEYGLGSGWNSFGQVDNYIPSNRAEKEEAIVCIVELAMTYTILKSKGFPFSDIALHINNQMNEYNYDSCYFSEIYEDYILSADSWLKRRKSISLFDIINHKPRKNKRNRALSNINRNIVESHIMGSIYNID